MTSILDLNTYCFLQEIFNYAAPVLVAPILVGQESIKYRENAEGVRGSKAPPLWIKVLETTRILIAHCSIDESKQTTELLKKIALNMRNLYRLFGMDLSEKQYWIEINEQDIYFVEPTAKGHFNVNLKDSLESVKTSDFLSMKTEFDFVEDDDYVKHVFGHCVYNLVATSDGKWKSDAKKYKSLGFNKLSPSVDLFRESWTT